MKKLDVLVTGVGGQGVVLASDIIGEVALAAGYDVKKTDTLGMAQRGGSVISHVRLGQGVRSPLASEGEADLILGFEKLEAARWGHFLRPQGTVIINNQALPPLSVSLGTDRYPRDEEIAAVLGKITRRVHFVDGTARAMQLGNARTLNVFMLGCASLFLSFKMDTWKRVMSQHLPAPVLQLNLKAFDLGRKEMRDVRRR